MFYLKSEDHCAQRKKEVSHFADVPFVCVCVSLSAVGPNTLCRPWTRSCVSWIRRAARGSQSWRNSSSNSSSHCARSSTTAKSTRNENTSSRCSQTHTANAYVLTWGQTGWLDTWIVNKSVMSVFTLLSRASMWTVLSLTPDFHVTLLELLTKESRGSLTYYSKVRIWDRA